MTQLSELMIGVLMLSLPACELQRKQAKTSVPPQPVVVAKAEPPPEPVPTEPLSTPQTQVQLPPPQPIDPAALADPPLSSAGRVAESQPAKKTTLRAGRGGASPKPEAENPPETAPPAAEARPPIEPLLPPGQRQQLIEDISARLKQVDQLLEPLMKRGPKESEKASLDRVRSLQTMAHEAIDKGDTETAGSLADRALVLAKELAGGQ